jgi:signal peptidase I
MIAVMIKTFLGQIFYVPSGSMQPTIEGAKEGGDRVVVNKLITHIGHTPRRGEVLVFRDELGWLDAESGRLEGARGGADSGGAALGAARSVLTFVGLLPSSEEKDLIKRVIGVGGDDVSCFKGGLFVNGERVNEPYVFPGDPPCKGQWDVQVPLGRLFVMGDHRSASADSTAHIGEKFSGTVSENAVIGPAYAVILPFDRAQRLNTTNVQ